MKSKTRIFLLFSAFILLKKSPAGYPKIRHKNVEIKEHKIYIIELLTEEPVDVGTDDKGVYEQVIEVKFYYERK